tara:strand:- start:233 stop:376 length:144 start_codon:yes stop_codon:yes gene_type:complete
MAESPSKKAKLEMKAVVLSEFGGPEKMSVGVGEFSGLLKLVVVLGGR